MTSQSLALGVPSLVLGRAHVPNPTSISQLPTEIRIDIFRCVFATTSRPGTISEAYRRIINVFPKNDVRDRKHLFWGSTAIRNVLLVNRQWHCEAKQALYRDFAFELYDWNIKYDKWLKALYLQTAEVQRIVINQFLSPYEPPTSYKPELYSSLKECLPKLKSIRIRVMFLVTSCPSPKQTEKLENALQGYTGVFRGNKDLKVVIVSENDPKHPWTAQLNEIVKRCNDSILNALQ